MVVPDSCQKQRATTRTHDHSPAGLPRAARSAGRQVSPRRVQRSFKQVMHTHRRPHVVRSRLGVSKHIVRPDATPDDMYLTWPLLGTVGERCPTVGSICHLKHATVTLHTLDSQPGSTLSPVTQIRDEQCHSLPESRVLRPIQVPEVTAKPGREVVRRHLYVSFRASSRASSNSSSV